MKFTLTIELGNDAMQNSFDVARALKKTADRLEMLKLGKEFRKSESGNISDDNGNTVGKWEAK